MISTIIHGYKKHDTDICNGSKNMSSEKTVYMRLMEVQGIGHVTHSEVRYKVEGEMYTYWRKLNWFDHVNKQMDTADKYIQHDREWVKGEREDQHKTVIATAQRVNREEHDRGKY